MAHGHQVQALLEEGLIEGGRAVYAKTKYDFEDRFRTAYGVFFDTFGARSGQEFAGLYSFRTKQTVSYLGKPELLAEDIKDYLPASFMVDVVCANAYLANI